MKNQQGKFIAMDHAFKIVWAGLILLLGVSTGNAEELPARNPEGANTATSDFNLWLNPGLISYHFNRNAGYRERNWGFGVQSYLSDKVSVMAGNYINSDYARSNYVGLGWQPLSLYSARIGVAVSAFDGYPAMLNGGWFAAILPLISIRNERVGVNFTIIPNYANRLHGA